MTVWLRFALRGVRSREGGASVQVIWKEICAGVRDTRWALYFGAILFPSLILAVLIAALFGWDVSQPPSPGVWLLVVSASLFSLLVAGLLDGTSSGVGRCAWGAAVAAVALWAILALVIARRPSRTVTVRAWALEVKIAIEDLGPADEMASSGLRLSWRRIGARSF